MIAGGRLFRAAALAALAASFSVPAYSADGEKPYKISGHVQTMGVLTESTGLRPETADNPLDAATPGSDLFMSANRARVKIEWDLARLDRELGRREKRVLVAEYEQRVSGGSFVGRGDYRVARRIRHERQAVDLSHSLVDEPGFVYEHGLHRLYYSHRSEFIDADAGRQQIPWGVGRFTTPTDVFNPFLLSELEWDERDGVDGLNLRRDVGPGNLNFVYTPRGGSLHPNREMFRYAFDARGYEVGLIGGWKASGGAAGYDLQGNVGDAALRSELLYEDLDQDGPNPEKDFVRWLVNLDYNFANGIYALIEYDYNGRGFRDPDDYDVARLVDGEIDFLGQNYLGLQLGYDVTPLVRIENSTFVNLDDESLFDRFELRDHLREDLILTLAAIWNAGGPGDEFGDKKNVYFAELEWFF